MVIVCLFPMACMANNNNINVLSYYAVGNSMDGQPMVDMVNVLRFYPVYAMRDSTTSVNVTVYYGSNVYNRNAEKMDGGRYWQVLLPQFKLGEAIQRFEVETEVQLEEQLFVYVREIEEVEKFRKKLKNQINDFIQNMENTIKSDENSREDYLKNQLKTLNNQKSKIDTLLKDTNLVNSIIKDINNNKNDSINILSISKKINKIKETYDILTNISNDIPGNQLSKIESIIYASDTTFINNIKESELKSLVNNLDSVSYKRAKYEDDLRNRILDELTDTTFSGINVRKSDIILAGLNNSNEGKYNNEVKILYRNYKRKLGEMPALDPAERLGLFRVRYVPFPITGGLENNDVDWLEFNDATVFEIGLAFVNRTISRDDIAISSFSPERFGVAIALTEDLFKKEETKVMALALTYDVNAYASLGIGANFADKIKNRLYISFGINKRAFEFLLKNIFSIFN